MKTGLLTCTIVCSLSLAITTCAAQEKKTDSTKTTKTNEIVNLITADSLQSGNFKNVLTSFFQLSFNDLIGPSKELNLNSNIYAIMLKSDSTLAVDTMFTKYRNLRKLNFSIGLRLDSSFNFNGLSSGLKYAIINQRDTLSSKPLLDAAIRAHGDIDTLHRKLTQYVNKIPVNEKQAFLNNIDTLMRSETVPFSKLDTSFQNIVRQVAGDNQLTRFIKLIDARPDLILHNELHNTSDSLKKALQNKWLWTAGVSDTTYAHKFAFSNLVLSTEVLKGILHPWNKINLELDVKASYNFTDDTLVKGTNLRRDFLYVEPGVNMVVKNKSTQKSFSEFKFSGSYYHQFDELYRNEKRDAFTFNGTISIRVIDDIWIPLKIQYDPKNGSLFGFLDVKANFSALKDILKTPAAKK